MRPGRLLLALLVASLAAAALLLPVRELLGAAFLWMQAHRSTSWALFVLIYTMATVCFVPGVPLTLAGGALFGMGPATVLVSIGGTLGATLAFLIGRTVARDWVAVRIAGWPRFRAIDRAVEDRGFLVVLLTRMTPALPCFLMNYAFGLTSVRLREYVLGSWLGMIPLTLAYAYAGSLAADLAEALSGGLRLEGRFWMLVALGLAATATLVTVLTRVARQQFAHAIGDDVVER